MSKRAARRKKMQTPVPVTSDETTPKQANRIRKAISEPRTLSTLCFSFAGLAVGLVTGLNHFPNLGALESLPRTLLLAAYLGDPHVNLAAGVTTALAGLLIGGCLGFSALSEAKDLLLSLLFSTVLAVGAVVVSGAAWMAGPAFLLGHFPAFLGYRRLQRT